MSPPKEESPTATAQVLTSSPKEKQGVPEGLPASEEPVGNGIKSKVPPKGAGVCPPSRRSTQMKAYKGKERRMTIRGEIGLGKGRSFKCVVCEKSFSKKSCLLIHQRRHTHSKRSAYAAYGETFAQREHQEGRADETGRDQSEFLLEEFTKMRQNLDLLILNQQAQLQVLQGIQKQLDVLLPGNDLINSNVCSLALLWSQQAAATRSVSLPFFLNPRNLLPGNTPHFTP